MSEILPDSNGIDPVKVSILPTGWLTHPDRWLFEDGDPDLQIKSTYPDFSFLIEHHSGRKILFDLGLPSDLSRISPLIRTMEHIIKPKVPKDAHDLLLDGPVHPYNIEAVMLSHLHFDHVGDCTTFPFAKILAGPGSRAATAPGWPAVEKSPFSSAVLEHPGYEEITWQEESHPIGRFYRTLDYFGDGSFYLLDAPGHMVGHMAGLALTSPGHWAIFGGDCCHHRDLLCGVRPMSVTVGPAGQPGFHKDPTLAQSTIDKISQLEETGSVFVALAHDSYLDGVVPLYPDHLNGWESSEWGERIRATVRHVSGRHRLASGCLDQ